MIKSVDIIKMEKNDETTTSIDTLITDIDSPIIKEALSFEKAIDLTGGFGRF